MEDNHQIDENDEFKEPSVEESSEEDSRSISLDQRTPEAIEEESPSIDDETPIEPEVPKAPSAFQRFARKALIWLAVIAVAFLGGLITSHFTRVQSVTDQLNQAETALQETKQEVNNIRDQAKTDLEEKEQEITDLKDQLATVTAERNALSEASDYRALLSIMADTYAARLALVEENTSAAKTALSDTEDTLNGIIEVIRGFDENLAEALPQRLELIRTNIDGNIENAIADCDLLIKDLRDIEKSLYQ